MENFDNSNHGWSIGVIGGVSSWSWANPNKLEVTDDITGGQECLILGGNTTTSTYNSDENSWVQSPVYDLTAVDNPYLEFWFYWSNENSANFDEIWMEVTTNNGMSWQILSAPASTQNCYDQNWYNFPDNWGGATTTSCFGGGAGPMGWVQVRKCVVSLANEPTVRFRFRLESGNFCEHFGATIDNFSVCDAFMQAEARFTCAGARTVNFIDSSFACPDSWAWDFGDGNSSTQQNPTHTYASPGNYTVTLIASASIAQTQGCGGPFTDTTSFSIEILEVVINPSQITCNGEANGSANAILLGTSNPVTYSWSPSPGGGQGTSMATNLAPGTYTVTITSSALGCPAVGSVVITEPPAITISGGTLGAACGQSNGAAFVTVSGGTGGYTYQWDDPAMQTASAANGLSAGTYSVIVTDGMGCQDSLPLVVLDISTAIVQIDTFTLIDCNGSNSGSATAAQTGGMGSLLYSWNTNPVQNGPIASNLTAGTYIVTLTDSLGCTSQDTLTLIEPPALVLDTQVVGISCSGECDGSAIVLPAGGTPPYVSFWNSVPMQIGDAATGLCDSTYRVVVNDQNGCVDSLSIPVPGQLPVIANFISSPPPGSSLLLPDGMISFLNTSQNATEYSWDFGDGSFTSQSDPLYEYQIPGEYCAQLIASNDSGCVDSMTACYSILVEELLVPNVFTPNGDQINDNFSIRGLEGFSFINLSVYDRWGNLVFEKEAYENEWNGNHGKSGKALPAGTYFYILIFGESLTGEPQENRPGEVSILR